MRKIAIVCASQFHSWMVLSYLCSKKNVEVTVITGTPKFRYKVLPEKTNVKFCFNPELANIIQRVTGFKLPRVVKAISLLVFQITSIMYLRRFDVIHGWSTHSLFFGVVAQKLFGSLYFVEKSCGDPEGQHQLLQEECSKQNYRFIPEPRFVTWIAYLELQAADKIICASKRAKLSFNKTDLFGKTNVVHCCLPRSIGTTGVRKFRRQPDDNGFNIGFLGGNLVRKGFIKIYKLARDNPEINILCRVDQRSIGEFLSKTNLPALPNIHQIDYLPDLDSFFARLHLFILPSLDEGFGMVALEALEHGVPVVMSDQCGAIDVLQDFRYVYTLRYFDEDFCWKNLMAIIEHGVQVDRRKEIDRLYLENTFYAEMDALYGP